MLGKLKALISGLRRDVINTATIKGALLRVEGDDINDPVIVDGYNILSVIRSATGQYTVTLRQGTAYGSPIISEGFFSLSQSIQPSAGTSVFYVRAEAIDATSFDIFTYEVVQGAGNQLDITSYDVQIGDFVSVMVLLSAGTGELPPE